MLIPRKERDGANNVEGWYRSLIWRRALIHFHAADALCLLRCWRCFATIDVDYLHAAFSPFAAAIHAIADADCRLLIFRLYAAYALRRRQHATGR